MKLNSTTVRYTELEREYIEEFMRHRRIRRLAAGLREMTHVIHSVDNLLITGKYDYIPSTDPNIRSIIDNLTIESRKKLLEALIEDLGKDEVNRLRRLNPDESGPIVD